MEKEELYEFMKARKEARRAKRAVNREVSAKRLREYGLEFTEHNGGAHLRVLYGDRRIDFWPGTGLWMLRDTDCFGRGVFDLIKFVVRDK